ncbi:MAG: hypothetical protein KA715_07990 [Xanthomonadaceae bacterium]|nr:hypothetical protein [Xanthomonadaceae bacterium]
MKNFPKGKIVFLTDLDHLEIRPVDEVWAEDLRSHGYLVEGAPWETFDEFESIDALVFRSPYNYFKKYKEFGEFLIRAERVGVKTFNSIQTVRQNIDKRYLRSLESSGVKIIPTQWFMKDDLEGFNSKFKFNKRPNETLIVKPTVSANSYSTLRISLADASDIKFAIGKVLEQATCAMVQPYLSEIETEGEWSMIYAGGKLTHTVRKFPKTGDFRVQEDHGGSTILMNAPIAVLEAGEKTLKWVQEFNGEMPLYVRVDGVESKDDGFLVMEVELTEPSLYFTHSPKSVSEFSAVLLKNLI